MPTGRMVKLLQNCDTHPLNNKITGGPIRTTPWTKATLFQVVYNKGKLLFYINNGLI